MSSIERRALVGAPIEVVWEVWTDVRLLPRLSATTVEVRDAPARLTRAGESFTQVARVARRVVEVTWEVTSIRRCDHLAIEGEPRPGTRVRMVEQVRAPGPRSCELVLRVDYDLPFGPVGALVGRLGLDRRAEHEAQEVVDGVARLALGRVG